MLKKLLNICMLIVVINISFSTIVFADNATVTAKTLNVRENASTSSKVLTTVKYGQTYDIIEQTDEWVKISKSNVAGWISKKYVSIEKIEEAVKQENSVEKDISKKVITKVLNVRENASTSSKVLFTLKKNSVVKTIETKDGWDKIEYNGQTGWAYNEYLIIQEADTSEVQEIKQAYINTEVLNVRKEANVTSKILGKLKYGNTVIINDEKNGWYEIEYDNSIGYVMIKYTKEVSDSISRGNYSRENSTVPNNIVNTALDYLGYDYIWGGTTEKGFDCSGFTYYVFKQYIDDYPRLCSLQAKLGEAVEKDDLMPADLVFFGYYGDGVMAHIGIYIGDGKFVHAANTKRGVVVDTLLSGYYDTNYLFARRVV